MLIFVEVVLLSKFLFKNVINNTTSVDIFGLKQTLYFMSIMFNFHFYLFLCDRKFYSPKTLQSEKTTVALIMELQKFILNFICLYVDPSLIVCINNYFDFQKKEC